MQPTLPQSNAGAADMDLPAAQSMDWLFRKERIYLLAQFWQQRATLAEKEVNTLKEQLSNTSITSTHSTTSTSSLSPNTTTVAQAAAAAAAASLLNKLTLSQTQQNGIPNSPPLSMTSSVDLMNPLTQNSKLLNNNNNNNSNSVNNNNNNNSKSNELLEKSETKENPNFNCNNLDEEDDEIDEEISKINSSKMDTNSNSSSNNNNNNNKSIKNNNNCSKINNHHLNNDDDNDNNNSGDNNNILDDDDDDDGGNKLNSSTLSSRSSTPAHQQQNNDKENSDSNNINSSSNNSNLNNNINNNNSNSISTRTLAEELAAKDKEISTLIEEVSRLRSAITALQESHQSQLKRLEDRIDAKREHITRLESRIDNQSQYDDVKKENSILSSVDFSSPQSSDTKQFQELLLERTKALAAQTEAIKSSSSDGTSTTNTTTTTTTNQDCQPQQQQQQPEQQQQQYEQPKLTIENLTSNSPSPQPIDIPSSSSSSSIINCVTPSITPVPLPILTGTANGELAKINLTPQSKLLNQTGPPPPSSNSTGGGGTSSNLQNVEQFGSFLGEEIVSNWRREITRERNNSYNHHNLRLNQSNNNNIIHNNSHNSNSINNHLNSPLLDGNHSLTHPDNDKSRSSHHDASSRASTPIHMSSGQDGRLSGISEENMHLNGLTALSQMSLNPHHHHSHHHQLQQYHHQLNQHHHQQLHQMSKSPIDDNNQHSGGGLGGPSNTGGSLIPGLPFQFQERGHFRFADDLQMPPGSMVGRLGDSLIPKGDPMEARLQEMLRYNMDKYSNQSLDTLHISRRVRELLSVHNIGQRLFAKYVLGLSQGTVSELLSKPKPWDKLTEKGRDSYRKMHAWGCDDNAVMLLKSLIPKKDKIDSGITQFGGRPENDITDERIQHILGEAANLMKTPSNSGGSINLPMNSQSQPPILQPNLMQTTQSSTSTTSSNLSAGGNSSGGNCLTLLSQMPQQPIKTEEIISNDEDSKSPPPNHCDSPFFPLSAKEAMLRNKMKKYDNDDISHEKVTRIYQEELAKLMSRAPPNLLFPHFFSGAAAAVTNHNQNSNGGNSQNNILPSTSPMPDDNIRLALEAYHRELAKIQAGGANLPNFPNFPNLPGLLALQQHALNGAQDLSLPKEKQMKINGSSQSMMSIDCESSKDMDESQSGRQSGSAFSLVRPKNESTPTTTASSAPSPIGNSILPPAITPTDDLAASPLQRMASITNSLITQPPVTPHHSTPQRPLKAVLPPITQQQFDMFNNLNTEDIVRRVKEALSQYSISQRLFGESVLGLSQGSVSDLLARPKPWHMLTQKGREPFIRMKMFLEDDNAVHKLVASQYKIAPEKLMRTGSYSGSPQIPSAISKAMPMMPKLMGEQLSKMQEEQQHRMLQQLQHGSPMGPHIPTSQPQTMLLTPPGLPPHHAIVLSSQEKAKQQAQAAAAAAAAQQAQQLQQQQAQQAAQQNMPMPIHSPQQQSNNPMRNMNQHMSPTVYEMAALTQDLDTQVITTKIKEALLANNIGQKIFGEAVLGLSQGSVSELLSKPKPWHMLSIKGREPFIRMQLWLADTNNVERLQVLKNERREANKRRRSTGPGAQDNSSDTSSNDTSEFYHSNSPGPASVGSASTGPPNKKQRVLFSEEQKEALRLAFQLDPYPNVATIEFLANELGLSTRTITNWFHNHRMRLKQQVPHGQPSEPVPSRDSVSGHPFDQNQFRALLHQRLMELQKERMGISGVPLPYAPYFAANPNLAALIQRGLIPGGDAASFAALNNAFKQEQMNGLDLSVKRDGDDDFDENDDEDNEDHNRLSDNESIEDSMEHLKNDPSKNLPPTSSTSLAASMARSSRRKPAAPQWVNPVWQDDKILASAGGTNIEGTTNKSNADEVIINGVCVMQQAADFSRLSDQTLRIEPSSFNDDGNDDDDDVRDKTAPIIKTEKIITNDRGDDDDDCDEVDDDDDVEASNLNTVNDSNNNNNDSNDDNKSNNNNSAENLVDETTKKIKTELNDTTDADRWDY